MSISFLCPTRGRAGQLARLLLSLSETCRGEWDFVAYVDDDDMETLRVLPRHSDKIKFVVGPRKILTQCWNDCLPLARGDIYCQMNDDCLLKTPGFDLMIEGAFAQCHDKILLVHGSDEGMHFEKFGAHSFVHRRWIDTVGYFIPPYFESDYGDWFLNRIADGLGRRKYLPFICEHLHFMFGKAEKDQTTLDRLERHRIQNPEAVWQSIQPELQQKMELLRSMLGTRWP